MKSFLNASLIFFACLTGLLSCKGKSGPAGIPGPTGPTGPFGPGATQYIYTGNFPSSIPSIQNFIVHVPEMTIDSDFQVLESSNAINWFEDHPTYDIPNQNVIFFIAPASEGYYYRITVKNYP